MLDEGISYLAIRDATGASTATISRVNKCYEYGPGGYRTVLDRLKAADKKTKEDKEKTK
jgi:TrpR-related protein YerC/YecD